MILQYKGFKNNWCYEEANTICWANANVDCVLDKYRPNGEKYLQREVDREASHHHVREVDLKYSHDMLNDVNAYLKEKTGCADEIVYLINSNGTPFIDMHDICVVTLKDKDKYSTYVFEKGVYILNNSGKTVQKIA